jgi:branched-chain amino acid transport system substrate-binding protein
MKRLLFALVLVLGACEGTEPAPGPESAPEGEAVQVRVGLLYTVTGQGAEFAQAALGSMPLAEADAERRGIDLDVLARDYGGAPDRAPALVQSLAEDGAAGVVVASDDPRLGQLLAGTTSIPVVHALLSDDDAVSEDSSTFRVAPSTALQAKKLASYLVRDRGYERVAILHEATPFGSQGADDLQSAIGRVGARVVLREGFRRGGDVHTPVTHAGQLDAQALVLWAGDDGEAGRVAIEMHQADQAYQLALSGNLATFDFGRNAVSQVTPVAFRDGILSVGTWAGPWFDLGRMQGYYERFMEENDAEAPFQAIQVHDGLLLLADAAARADGDPAAVPQALEETSGFVGAGVPLSFEPDDHEGVDLDDMAILSFTKDQASAGGEFAPDVSTGGGFFTINGETVELPPELGYLLEGVPA